MDSVEGNFYLGLQSSQTLEYFPSNSGSSFSVKLSKTLKFPPKLYEVGLVQFYYTPPEPAKDENGNYIIYKPKFFGKATGDNLITILQHTEAGFTIKKEDYDLLGFVQNLNIQLQNRNFDITFILRVTDHESKWVIDHKAKDNEGFSIPYELATVMGFDKSIFSRGENPADWDYSSVDFEDFQKDKTFQFSIFNKTPKTLVVEEPKEYKIVDLMSSINKTLISYGCSFDFEVGELVFTSNHLGLMVKLSAGMSQILGIAADRTFHTSKMKVESNPELILYTPSTFMLIKCNCAGNQVFGPKLLPILRILPIPQHYGLQKEYTFSPVQYVSVSDPEISEITIELLDEQMRPLSSTLVPTTVLLHFRQRPL